MPDQLPPQVLTQFIDAAGIDDPQARARLVQGIVSLVAAAKRNFQPEPVKPDEERLAPLRNRERYADRKDPNEKPPAFIERVYGDRRDHQMVQADLGSSICRSTEHGGAGARRTRTSVWRSSVCPRSTTATRRCWM